MKKRLTGIVFLFLFSFLLLANGNEVKAADTVTNLKQTYADDDMVRISFTGTDADGYYVYYSTDNSTFKRVNGTSSSDTYPDTYEESIYINNLSAGKKYYVKVSPATLNSTTYEYSEGTKSSTLQVVTSPKKVSGLKQTAATKSSGTVSWTAVSGVTGYYVRDGYGNKVKTVSSAKAKITMDSCSSEYYYVSAYLKSSAGYIAEGDDKSVYVCSAPGKPSKVASVSEDNLSWNLSNNKVTVWWDKNANDEYYPDGYQVQIYTINGKTKLKTYNVKSNSKSFKLSKVKNKGFKIRVRAYAKNNGTKYYGPWTSKKAVVPLAKVTSFDQKGKTSATVKWKKVKNATKYTIYVCKNLDVKHPTWKKVKSVSKSKTSYTIKNLKKGKSVGVYVVPTVKAGSKKYTAARISYDYDSTYIY